MTSRIQTMLHDAMSYHANAIRDLALVGLRLSEVQLLAMEEIGPCNITPDGVSWNFSASTTQANYAKYIALWESWGWVYEYDIPPRIKDWKSGFYRENDVPMLYVNFYQAHCRREIVRYEAKQVPIYEDVCDPVTDEEVPAPEIDPSVI